MSCSIEDGNLIDALASVLDCETEDRERSIESGTLNKHDNLLYSDILISNGYSGTQTENSIPKLQSRNPAENSTIDQLVTFLNDSHGLPEKKNRENSNQYHSKSQENSAEIDYSLLRTSASLIMTKNQKVAESQSICTFTTVDNHVRNTKKGLPIASCSLNPCIPRLHSTTKSAKRNRSISSSCYELRTYMYSDSILCSLVETSTPRRNKFLNATLIPLTPIKRTNSMKNLSNFDFTQILKSSSTTSISSSRIDCVIVQDDRKVSKLCPKTMKYEDPECSSKQKSFVIKPEVANVDNSFLSSDSYSIVTAPKVQRKIDFSYEEYLNGFNSSSENFQSFYESEEVSQASTLTLDESTVVSNGGWMFNKRIAVFLDDRLNCIMDCSPEERNCQIKLYQQKFIQEFEVLLSVLVQKFPEYRRNDKDIKVVVNNIFDKVAGNVNEKIWEYVDYQISFDSSIVMKAGLDVLDPNLSPFTGENLDHLFKKNTNVAYSATKFHAKKRSVD